MKKGSALLIVLGMLSFMVVSAVGFSIYMRSSRTPSSYLRRNVAARYLVRSALAKAIEELEGDYNRDPDWGKVDDSETDVSQRFYGIYDDPFPGVVLGDATARSNPLHNGDYWLGRVFMPFGAVRSTDATVPTLTLEALAYLPPAIIDDVRRLSRLTRTASWRSFPYDAGRYAYCAVNVSDLFDINRLRANVPRNSGLDRVTLVSLCADSLGDIMSIKENSAQALDDLLDSVEDHGKINGNVVPFTSLADFNVLTGSGSEYAPFMDFIGTTETGPLTSKSGSSKTANAMFITDTWFPPLATSSGKPVFDLASNAQPFREYTAKSFDELIGALNETVVGNTKTYELYANNLGAGLICLYDYLDGDSQPVSLAMPTTEAVPMAVGISSPLGIEMSLDSMDGKDYEVTGLTGTAEPKAGGGLENVGNIVAKRNVKLMGVKFSGSANVPVVVTCPFKRLKTTNRAKNWKVRGIMKVWAAPKEMGCRPQDRDGNLYPATFAKDAKNGVATFVSAEKSLPFSSIDVRTTDEAVADITLEFNCSGVPTMPVFYAVHEEVDQGASGKNNPDYKNFNADPDNLKRDYKSLGDIYSNASYKDRAFRPLALDGTVAADWAAKASAARFDPTRPYSTDPARAGLTELQSGDVADFRIHAAIWLQIVDNNGEVVDMAPACAKDDDTWLKHSAGDLDAKMGNGTPLLGFRGNTDVKFKDIDTTLPSTVAFENWGSLYAVDPRYNFAPEDWYAEEGQFATGNKWLQNVTPLLGVGGRDHDIFMFVSDQEYLQSIGELQFLPYIEDLTYQDGKLVGGIYNPDINLPGRGLCAKPFSDRMGIGSGNFANVNRFWRTYSAYPCGSVAGTADRNPYYLRDKTGEEVTVLSGGNLFKLNPFSRDDRVLFAALVGTPFDYYVASTNYNHSQSGAQNNSIAENMSLKNMMDTFSFGKSGVAKLSNSDIKSIAEEIRSGFDDVADSGDADWLSAWEDDLLWQSNDANHVNENNKTFMDSSLQLSETLHGVDRKYLYSFWRDCFDNRQQLFLIFVRAEPSSVGGGGMSRASSQLGARAVALVWRDPEIPEKNKANRKARTELNSRDAVLDAREECPPHRTRVLFYHQFD